jgi:hypothetical protein
MATAGMLFYQYSTLSILILFIPGILTALVYNHARKNFGDILYYFVLDGLMALSALLMLVTSI